MIVVIAGMHRSGSTFVFNAVRELLEKRGKTIWISSDKYEDVMALSKGYKNIIIKSHLPDEGITRLVEEKKAVCIGTIREPQEAIRSLMRVFGFSFEISNKHIFNWLGWYQQNRKFVSIIKYQLVNHAPLIAVILVGWYIFAGLLIYESIKITKKYNKNRLRQKLKELKPDDANVVDAGFSYYDKETFFHRNHISEEGEEVGPVLSEEQQRFIQEEARKYGFLKMLN
ncbi:hypothetical protein M1116_00605 [Patescibacteria group bacterium]|nr:hypothetical protein [Patescibacteria group bacterium]